MSRPCLEQGEGQLMNLFEQALEAFVFGQP